MTKKTSAYVDGFKIDIKRISSL